MKNINLTELILKLTAPLIFVILFLSVAIAKAEVPISYNDTFNTENSCDLTLFQKVYDPALKKMTEIPFIPSLIEKTHTKIRTYYYKAKYKYFADPQDNIPPVIDIISNDGEEIKLKVGKMKFWSDRYFYSIFFNDNLVTKLNCVHTEGNNLITISTPKSGKYTITFYRHSNGANSAYYEGILWQQDFIAINKFDIPFTKDEIKDAANKLAPISLFPEEEKYRPGSLEYIFNKVDVDHNLAETTVKLNMERFRKVYAFKFKNIDRFLPFQGDNDGVFDTISYANAGVNNINSIMAGMLKRKNKLYSTIYYSLIPSETSDEYYLMYHYLYAFDEKMGSDLDPSRGKHVFDRESFVIVLNEKLEPQSIVYGAHMEGQKLNIVDNKNIIQSSDKGRVRLPWKSAYKFNGHPIIAIAKGSHAIYPALGTYTFTMLKDKLTLLSEKAGGKFVMLPSDLRTHPEIEKSLNIERFKVKSLDIGRITSHSWNSVLAFSGYLVDVIGWNDARFPPFTKREMYPNKWIEGADWVDPSKLPKESRSSMKEILGNFNKYVY